MPEIPFPIPNDPFPNPDDPLDAVRRWILRETQAAVERKVRDTVNDLTWALERRLPDVGSCNLSTSLLEITLDEMFIEFSSDILEAGHQHNIDARAIAGAIAWEYEENMEGLWSDYLQYHLGRGLDIFTKDPDLPLGEGIGWGSIHTERARLLHPTATNLELQCLRLDAASAIEMIGAIMGQASQDYFTLSGGIWIGNAPPILALFFHTGDDLLKESAAKRRLDPCKPGQTVELDASQDTMATWVKSNLDRFIQFSTRPEPPTTCYASVTVK
ncbi:hypothetical protein [Candidatus Thiosymbion oneisti]|uniref:hypothetical protein n=1 Tax=Candidatus Thiosymbion oneisti TaxID=589554 RepID=UPI00105EFFB6|nr:hypothetical protein [Candidatus Thiosymbion oneisti]